MTLFYIGLVNLLGSRIRTDKISIKFHHPEEMKDEIEEFCFKYDEEIKYIETLRDKLFAHNDTETDYFKKILSRDLLDSFLIFIHKVVSKYVFDREETLTILNEKFAYKE